MESVFYNGYTSPSYDLTSILKADMEWTDTLAGPNNVQDFEFLSVWAGFLQLDAFLNANHFAQCTRGFFKTLVLSEVAK